MAQQRRPGCPQAPVLLPAQPAAPSLHRHSANGPPATDTPACRRLPSQGYLAYAAVYTGLEVLAVPAIPLTMTAGVIFGPAAGTMIVSVSATTAATIAFLIARYAARDKVRLAAWRAGGRAGCLAAWLAGGRAGCLAAWLPGAWLAGACVHMQDGWRGVELAGWCWQPDAGRQVLADPAALQQWHHSPPAAAAAAGSAASAGLQPARRAPTHPPPTHPPHTPGR